LAVRARARSSGAALAASLLIAAIALGACGGPAADLFEVIRSGKVPGADISLIPSGDGSVRCAGRRHQLPDKLLLTAENFDFTYHAKRHEELSSGPDPVYTYVVRTPDGIFGYSDDSPHLGPQLRALAAWTFTVAKRICR
jgi:hypothetical protein